MLFRSGNIFHAHCGSTSSIILQKIIKPFLPLLEKISPARHHSTAAHKTSLTSIETDDVSLFFRYFDGFFLYGFLFAFAEKDFFTFFDPKQRDTSRRDFDWFESVWARNTHNNDKPYIGKLFSLSTNLPAFQKRFPDSKILYMIRDPLNVIPSGLSLVTGVLDKRFGFWSLENKEDLLMLEDLITSINWNVINVWGGNESLTYYNKIIAKNKYIYAFIFLS